MATAKKEKRKVLTIDAKLVVSYPEDSTFDALGAFNLIDTTFTKFSEPFIEQSGGKLVDVGVKLKFKK